MPPPLLQRIVLRAVPGGLYVGGWQCWLRTYERAWAIGPASELKRAVVTMRLLTRVAKHDSLCRMPEPERRAGEDGAARPVDAHEIHRSWIGQSWKDYRHADLLFLQDLRIEPSSR